MQKSVHSPFQKELEALLRALRHEAGLTQRGLAERLGVPQSRISDYEVGESLMDILVLRQYVRELGTDLPEFVRLLEERLAALPGA